ncbi:thioredoxin reductase [Halobaculum magnesiiphilum]|uniref:Thioredoxin reductase n=1 Tax=Halobaculum magnesiiphilum TaxID=1017351 RepID=A0A8T8WIT4_9EURY|nr:thioredoxin reductase [Halobaculum magnesiiphilum]QZP39789.1 thioredoxin reductase [Halobaculum magnesiiphilum]
MPEPDHEVVVVGGGPTGTGVGVFTARYGLDTVVYDRGNAALARAAFIENYPGFPGGIDVETLTALFRDHLAEAGGDRREDLVESVERDDTGFRVTPADGEPVTARYVVAAAWYDASYLRALDDGDEFFETHEHHGEEREQLDRDLPNDDGSTPVDGLYVAAPTDGRNDQVAIAVGHGAHVARTVLADLRRSEGFSGGVVPHYDWLRPDSEFTGEWADRDRWREWFDSELHGDDEVPAERIDDLRERYIDRAFATRLSEEEIAARRERGHRRLAEHLDSDVVLDAIDDEEIAAYLADGDAIGSNT